MYTHEWNISVNKNDKEGKCLLNISYLSTLMNFITAIIPSITQHIAKMTEVDIFIKYPYRPLTILVGVYY